MRSVIRSSPRSRIATLVGALALAVTACGGSSGPATQQAGGDKSKEPSSKEPSAQQTIAGLAANVHESKDVTGMTELDVEADDFYFEPTVITGSAGQKLTLHIENEGGAEHNFTLAAQSIDKDIESSEEVTVHVTIPQSGLLSFFCEYHKSRGMAGGLGVTGSSPVGGDGSGSSPDDDDSGGGGY